MENLVLFSAESYSGNTRYFDKMFMFLCVTLRCDLHIMILVALCTDKCLKHQPMTMIGCLDIQNIKVLHHRSPGPIIYV